MQVELDQTGTHIPWNAFPSDPKVDQDDHWLALITGYDPNSKYSWESTFLDHNTNEGEKLYNVVQLTGRQKIRAGDILRENLGADTQFYRVQKTTSNYFEVEKISTKDAMMEFGADPDHPEVKGTGIMDVDIRLTGERDDLEDVMETLDYLLPIEDMEVSFQEEFYEMDDSDKERVYGDIELNAED